MSFQRHVTIGIMSSEVLRQLHLRLAISVAFPVCLQLCTGPKLQSARWMESTLEVDAVQVEEKIQGDAPG